MSPTKPRLSGAAQTYALVVLGCGLIVIALSIRELLQQPRSVRLEWSALAALTFVSGWLSVKLPTVSASISISETFVIAGTVMFGPAVGTVLVGLDVLVLCLKDSIVRRTLSWQKLAFNLACTPISIWLAAQAVGLTRPIRTPHLDAHFVAVLATFTALYFILNSWLVTFAVALEYRTSPFPIWRKNFLEIFVNYAAGAFIAAFLIVNAAKVDLAFVGVILPLLLVIYFTYRWSTKRVEAEREKVQELNRVFLSTVEALALAIDAKDQVTHGHIRRVQRYTIALASALGVKDQQQIDAIRAAALLHDTGKLAVPEYILNKPGPLTAAEFERMKVHADVGADILKSINFPYPVEPIVRHHHEQWNGRGYPAGLQGQAIPIGARILSVVDCYDALTSDRPYRPRMSRAQAEQELKDRRGTSYDPWVVDQFLTILDELERQDKAEETGRLAFDFNRAEPLKSAQLDVISATTAEEREFNELRRDLPRAATVEVAVDALHGHLRRILPLATVALYLPSKATNDLCVVACCGSGSTAMLGATVGIGDRISGWCFANSQVVLNSDATLELGPVAKTLSVPLRYAVAVPLIDGRTIGLVMVYGGEPFHKDHQRLLENAATIFVSSVPQSFLTESRTPVSTLEEQARPKVH